MTDYRDDLVSRQAVLEALLKEYNYRFMQGDRGGLKLAWIEKAVDSVPAAQLHDDCGPDACEIGGQK